MDLAAGEEMATVIGLFVGRPRAMRGDEVGPERALRPPPTGDDGVDGDGGGSGADGEEPTAWVSAIAKGRCVEPVHLGASHLAGDEQADRRVHGGPDKAVCVYPGAHYPTWWAEPDQPDHLGSDRFGPGAFGENVTLSAPVTELDVCIGDVYRLGTATVQLSQPRMPCWKLGRRWAHPELTTRTSATGRTGWYLRVIDEGVVAPDAALVLVDRPHPEWTVAEANRVMVHDRHDLDGAERLGRIAELAADWSVPLLEQVARRR